MEKTIFLSMWISHRKFKWKLIHLLHDVLLESINNLVDIYNVDKSKRKRYSEDNYYEMIEKQFVKEGSKKVDTIKINKRIGISDFEEIAKIFFDKNLTDLRLNTENFFEKWLKYKFGNKFKFRYD